jgi:hypothetical protein
MMPLDAMQAPPQAQQCHTGYMLTPVQAGVQSPAITCKPWLHTARSLTRVKCDLPPRVSPSGGNLPPLRGGSASCMIVLVSAEQAERSTVPGRKVVEWWVVEGGGGDRLYGCAGFTSSYARLGELAGTNSAVGARFSGSGAARRARLRGRKYM